MIIKTNVMIFAFPVKWLVMFLENDIMFSKPDVMLFLLFHILLPRLEFYSVTVPYLFWKGVLQKWHRKGCYKLIFCAGISSPV